jgi:hypothetical protein
VYGKPVHNPQRYSALTSALADFPSAVNQFTDTVYSGPERTFWTRSESLLAAIPNFLDFRALSVGPGVFPMVPCILIRVTEPQLLVVVQFVIHKAGILNWPVGNCRYASPYGYGFQ